MGYRSRLLAAWKLRFHTSFAFFSASSNQMEQILVEVSLLLFKECFQVRHALIIGVCRIVCVRN